MKYNRGYTIVEFLVTVLTVVGTIGWIWNIVKITGSDFSAISGMLILRCIGILVAPLGAILGYL